MACGVRLVFVALSLIGSFALVAQASAPSSARSRRASFCRTYAAQQKVYGYHPVAIAKKGPVTLLNDKRRKTFFACNAKRRTHTVNEALPGVRTYKLQKLTIGGGGKCAAVVIKMTGHPKSNGFEINKTAIGEFRLYSYLGSGAQTVADVGSGNIKVLAMKFSSNCFLAWGESRSDGRKFIAVSNMSNQTVFNDPNTVPYGFEVQTNAELKGFRIRAKGRGAKLIYKDGGEKKTVAIPAS